MLKEFMGKLRYMRRSIFVHKYTFHFDTACLGLVPYKESLVYKIAIVSTVQFISFIDFEWFNNGLVDNSSLYNHTATSLLPSFNHKDV